MLRGTATGSNQRGGPNSYQRCRLFPFFAHASLCYKLRVVTLLDVSHNFSTLRVDIIGIRDMLLTKWHFDNQHRVPTLWQR
jgi:hypothetical protein